MQQVLVSYLCYLDDGLVVQMLLQGGYLVSHQLVGLVGILAAVVQQPVGVLHLPAGICDVVC